MGKLPFATGAADDARESAPVMILGGDGSDVMGEILAAVSALATEVQGLRADIAEYRVMLGGDAYLRTKDTGL